MNKKRIKYNWLRWLYDRVDSPPGTPPKLPADISDDEKSRIEQFYADLDRQLFKAVVSEIKQAKDNHDQANNKKSNGAGKKTN